LHNKGENSNHSGLIKDEDEAREGFQFPARTLH